MAPPLPDFPKKVAAGTVTAAFVLSAGVAIASDSPDAESPELDDVVMILDADTTTTTSQDGAVADLLDDSPESVESDESPESLESLASPVN